MLLAAGAAAAHAPSRRLPHCRPGGCGGGAPPRIWAAELGAPTTLPLLRRRFLGCSCSPSPSPGGDEDGARQLFDEFSVLSTNIPWEVEDIWRTFAAYFFIFHIPFSFGGLGVVAELLHCPSLDPLTTVSSTVVLQLTELTLALALLQYSTKKDHKLWAFFQGKLYPQHSWVKETVLGLIFLMTVVSLTTVVADRLIGLEDTYDPMLREILSDSPTSRLLCVFLYCVIAPLSEETIYRGFLLTALSSSMKWKDAVIVSSLMFSIAHFSINNSFQLFVIGCITGLAYSRTGTLAAPLTIHSLYNAAILHMTLMS
uniref:CAAX prenyl protease 2/Lysostaphin resistance protein A-like domain-containing protein n=1 Tax=Oryza rufipogon TaxID=4529 RepID=A0A0E0Q7S6_ORYRU